MSETQVCPRRAETIGASTVFNIPVEDTWIQDRCSYCGSLRPALALERIAAGAEVTPTDKSYKMYLGNDKAYFQHFSREQAEEFIRLYNAHEMKILGGDFYVKPYWMVPVKTAQP